MGTEETICLSSEGPTIDDDLDGSFGRCNYFIFYTPARASFQVVKNPAAELSGGAGVKAAQHVVQAGATVVWTGQIGPNVQRVFDQAGIPVRTGCSGPIRSLIDDYQQKFNPNTARTNPSPSPSLSGSVDTQGTADAQAFGQCRCRRCGYSMPQQSTTPCFKQRCPSCGTPLEWQQ